MAFASGGLLFIHGLIHLSQPDNLLSTSVRYLRYGVDTVLITAALMLTNIVQQFPFIDAWLTVKFLLLMVYLFLSHITLYNTRNQRKYATVWGLALMTWLFIFSVAKTHQSWGIFSLLF
jgi:uncharacterized membrane protein SirB2